MKLVQAHIKTSFAVDQTLLGYPDLSAIEDTRVHTIPGNQQRQAYYVQVCYMHWQYILQIKKVKYNQQK